MFKHNYNEMTEVQKMNFAGCHDYMFSPEGVPFWVRGHRMERAAEGWTFTTRRDAASVLASKNSKIQDIVTVEHNPDTGKPMISKDIHSFYTPDSFGWNLYNV